MEDNKKNKDTPGISGMTFRIQLNKDDFCNDDILGIGRKDKYKDLNADKIEQILEDLYYKAKDDSDIIDCDWFTNPKVPAPEGWEDNLREKLKKEYSDGCYNISSGNIRIQTGKGGYIDYLISIEKEMRGYI